DLPELPLVRLVEVGDVEDPDLVGVIRPQAPHVGGVRRLHGHDQVGPVDLAGREPTGRGRGEARRARLDPPTGRQLAADRLGHRAPGPVLRADEEEPHDSEDRQAVSQQYTPGETRAIIAAPALGSSFATSSRLDGAPGRAERPGDAMLTLMPL